MQPLVSGHSVQPRKALTFRKSSSLHFSKDYEVEVCLLRAQTLQRVQFTMNSLLTVSSCPFPRRRKWKLHRASLNSQRHWWRLRCQICRPLRCPYSKYLSQRHCQCKQVWCKCRHVQPAKALAGRTWSRTKSWKQTQEVVFVRRPRWKRSSASLWDPLGTRRIATHHANIH